MLLTAIVFVCFTAVPAPECTFDTAIHWSLASHACDKAGTVLIVSIGANATYQRRVCLAPEAPPHGYAG